MRQIQSAKRCGDGTEKARVTVAVIEATLDHVMALADKALDQWLDWKMPRILGGQRLWKEEHLMQRQFTIELRVDYADADKNETMRTALQAAARHVYATAALLADAVKPQIAIFSDDFFLGHEEIALLQDTIQEGRDQIGGKDETISSELMNALKPDGAPKV